MSFHRQLAESLKNHRMDACLTQAELAELISVTPNAISQYETARRMPSIEIVSLIAEVLGVQIDDIVPPVERDAEPPEGQTTIFDVIGE